MNKRTPGPWRAEYTNDTGPEDDYFQQWWDIVNVDGDTIAEVYREADSRLIAAAPELLASLRRVLRMLEINDARLANFGEVEEARDVISKAEGAPYWGE